MTTLKSLATSQFSEGLILKALHESSEPTAIYSEENMIIRFANKGMLELWGKDASIVGMPLLDAIPELVGQSFFSLLQNVWYSGESYSVKGAPAELIKSGVRKVDYYDYTYKALLNQDGKTWCILNTAREVTSEKEYLEMISVKEKREEALNNEMAATLKDLYSTNESLRNSMNLLWESREHVRTIIEQAPVGIAMLRGKDHVIEIANKSILKIWGRRESEVLNRPHRIARPELRGQKVFDWLDEVIITGERKTNNEFTVRLYHNGSLRDAIVNSIYQPIFSSDGEVTGVLIILDEITEQVTARRKNEKDQHMLAMAIQAGELATFYYEPATNLFSGNLLLHTWFGLKPLDHIDLSKALAVIVEEDRARVTQTIMRSLSKDSDGHYATEYQIQLPHEPSPRMVQARGKVFYDQGGQVISLNGTLRDITEQKKDEQRKDDFIGMVSHELKTPLTSLSAYLQLIQRDILLSQDFSMQTKVERSLRQVQYMNTLINGFLNISRLDSGKMVLDKSYFALSTLFSELEAELTNVIHSHFVVFKYGENIKISADREKISQVIYNLVGNAVKYSPAGSTIHVSCNNLNLGMVEIQVSDEGMGISEQDQQQIFERYYRVKSSKMGSIAGFGIGLYLCKEILELHNGSISVESNGEKGTCFSIILPL
ncbi:MULTISPECIES: PAS domain-containing sensor histidine kinase [Sphingobacterium]|uniref:histidine kinase n=1 Tax=Sphingobacterium populi TaxID=1812824 RepID=A0ABW5U9G5_9SPHI|nr:PAS domain-containing sensor histidine kinase [Sphingobacterium sp. CFCC 11742]